MPVRPMRPGSSAGMIMVSYSSTQASALYAQRVIRPIMSYGCFEWVASPIRRLPEQLA